MKQVGNSFRASALNKKHLSHYFNWKNIRKHSATARVSTRNLSGWIDIIHVSIAAQTDRINFLFVYQWHIEVDA